MAVTGTLEQIREKVRKITGRPSQKQLSDSELDNYINDFYVYDMPQHLKLFNLQNIESPLLATTTGGDGILVAGKMAYAIDWNKFINIEPPFYVAGYQINYFQNAGAFLSYFPSQQTSAQLATGTGAIGPYSGTVSGTPILSSSVFITAKDATGNTLVAQSNDTGGLTGDVAAGGTIDLTTGAVANLNWTAAIPLGEAINIQYLLYTTGRPTAVLFYNKALVFYPVPDTAYEVFCTVFYAPDDLASGDQPEIRQWWNVIALGASLKIFIDNMDLESYAKIMPIFDEQRRLVERRTLKQISTQRVATIYDYGMCYSSSGCSYPLN